ncbi:ankyrin [Coprinopsis marcescibilis]|uniref:Ankyrin n=1 Tax=Coprinopsis marcescibilis TaxID=230819 RepID=A0A5C3KKT1_COPMA|nr:ankyrin [Coprinopsis marcescibilis]
MLASRRPDTAELVEMMLKLGCTATINAKDAIGQTALAHAAESGSTEAVRILLGVEGIDHSCLGAYGRTPLMLAAERGCNGIVALLLEVEGIKFDCRDIEGKTALAHAILNGHVKICQDLLMAESTSASYTTSEGWNFYLMLAAAAGNATVIRSVLQLGHFDVNARDIHHCTALAYAVGSKSYGAVEALLEVEGVDIHCLDKQGRTLLMEAARRGEVMMVNRFLRLGLGANINTTDIRGSTALAHALVRGGSKEVVRMLLGVEGTDYNCVDARGQTPLMMAATQGYDDIVALLLEREGIKVDFRDTQLDINTRDIHYCTALTYAIGSRSDDAVEALLEVEGIDIHCFDRQGRTPLMNAVRWGRVEIAKRFIGLGLGANINAKDNEGMTVLSYAVLKRYRNDLEVVSALLKVEGIDLSVRDVKGRTPLMVAIENRNDECAELLRKAGAS